MSGIVVRPYEPRDQEATWHVRAMTYNSGRAIPLEEQVYKTSTPYVGEVDGRIVGTFVIMDLTCTRGPNISWKAGGIAGVAVLPEARQTGVGSAMMRWALRHMRSEGYVVASLYAFRESYYRTFGYEVCGARYKISCPQSRLPRLSAELPVRRVPIETSSEIRLCYDAFAQARSGMNLRTEMHWGRILSENRTVYAAGVIPEAYAIVEHVVDFWVEQRVVEFIWCSERGYRSMLAFFRQLGINKTMVTWHEPSDSPFVAQHLDEGVRVEVEKPIMYRLLDAPTALGYLGGDYAVSIDDPDLPENAGPWHVSSSGVERTSSAEWGIDCRSAVQAVLGSPSLDDLVRNGIAFDCPAARMAMPPLPVYCTEFF